MLGTNSKKCFTFILLQAVLFTVILLILDLIPKSENNITGRAKFCARYPTAEYIIVDNVFWQVLEHSKGLVSILNAYLDMRQNQSSVRINVNSKYINGSDFFFCQLWFNDTNTAEIVRASDVLLAWDFGHDNDKVKYPFMIECPFNGTVPTSVSLVELPCDSATNNLEIINVQPLNGVKKRFGVCSKKAMFKNRDFAVRFVEWVHMMRILGAEKIHFSYDYVHPDMFKIINYFEEKGIVETWQYLNPTGISDSEPGSWQGYQLEVNTQTDCFYKVMNLYDFVAILDMDEVITPVMQADSTWEDIIRRANILEYKDAFVSQNVYYPEIGAKPIEEIPGYFYMLQHIQRSQNFSDEGHAVKSLFATERVLAVHTHMPHYCFPREQNNYWCVNYYLSKNISQNSHFRDHLDEGTTFNVTKEDKTLWKYKDRLIKAVQGTLKDLNFTP